MGPGTLVGPTHLKVAVGGGRVGGDGVGETERVG